MYILNEWMNVWMKGWFSIDIWKPNYVYYLELIRQHIWLLGHSLEIAWFFLRWKKILFKIDEINNNKNKNKKTWKSTYLHR